MQSPKLTTDKAKARGKLLRLDCRFIKVSSAQRPQKTSLGLHSHWQAPPTISSRRKVHKLQWITVLCKRLPTPAINEDNSA